MIAPHDLHLGPLPLAILSDREAGDDTLGKSSLVIPSNLKTL